MNPKHRLGGADGVRALACLMVMAHHACQRLSLPDQVPWVQDLQLFLLTGAAGVGVFFVLSGFLLSSPFWRAWADGHDRPSLATYGLRRWARIAPAFWLNLVLTFVLAQTFVPEAPNQVLRFLAGLTFTASFSWKTLFPVEINGPLWSVGFEVASYALLAAFLALWFLLPGRRTWPRGFGFWIGVFGLAVAVHGLFLLWGQTGPSQKGWEYGMVGGAKYWWPMYNPVGFFATFVVGVLAAGVAEALGRRPGPASGWADLGVVAALGAWALLLWVLRKEGDFAFSWPAQPYYFPTFALVVGVVLGLGPRTRWAGRWLDNPPARFLATISFGLYIWHYLLIELTQRFLVPEFHYFGIQDPLRWLGIVAGVYAGAAVLATASWYLFEKPIVDWSQKRGRLT